jgi:hypothetical protein
MTTQHDPRTPEQQRAALHRIVEALPDRLMVVTLWLLEMLLDERRTALRRAGVEPDL